MNGSTHAGRLESCCGGVGRNVADCLSHLRLNPLLISAIGDDSNGDTLLAHIPHMDTRGISRIVGASTAVYAAILDKNGECVFGIGDMDVHSQITVHQVKSHEHTLVEAPLVAIDGNIPLDTMDYMLHYCSTHGIPDLSLEAHMAKLKQAYFGAIMGADDSMEKQILLLGKHEGSRGRRRPRMRSLDAVREMTGLPLHVLKEMVQDQESWRMGIREVARSRTRIDGT